MKKIVTILISSILLLSSNLKAENYIYGGPKLFYYDVTNEDLQSTANELVNLGFSSAKVSANTSGVGFDIGFGGISALGLTWISKF